MFQSKPSIAGKIKTELEDILMLNSDSESIDVSEVEDGANFVYTVTFTSSKGTYMKNLLLGYAI